MFIMHTGWNFSTIASHNIQPHPSKEQPHQDTVPQASAQGATTLPSFLASPALPPQVTGRNILAC